MKPQFKTPSDITKLDGYVGAISKDHTELSKILYHYYIWPDQIKCALCGTLHMDGRIIALHGGGVSNIGHECGKKYFGDSYQNALDNFTDEHSIAQLRRRVVIGVAALNTARLSYVGLENRAYALRQQHDRFQAIFPALTATLRRRAIENTSHVTESVVRSKEEIDDLMEANPHQKRERLAFKEIPRGTVAGFRFGHVDWSPSTGSFKLLHEINHLCDLQLVGLKLSPLKKHAVWFDEFNAHLSTVRNFLEDGEAFFNCENFRLFAYLTHDPEAKQRLALLRPADLKALPASAHTTRPRSIHSGIVRGQRHKPELSAKQMRRLLGDKKAR